MLAQRAIFANRVTPIMAFDRAQERIVFTVAKEIMVDGAHTRGDTQPAVQVVQRGLTVAKIVISASLKFDREQAAAVDCAALWSFH